MSKDIQKGGATAIREVRCIEARFQFRAEAEADSRRVRGYAALFNSRTVLWDGYEEVIAKGAFDNVLKDDVRALFNHDPNLVLARTAANTLTIGVDDEGLWYEFELPNTTAGNDLLESMKRGDVTQSSFGFSISDSTWIEETKDGKTVWLRTIKSLKRLYDVSPVTYPAYTDTSVALRSAPEPVAKPIVNHDETRRLRLRLLQLT